jgi:AhpD family alkylhydroperoxidase
MTTARMTVADAPEQYQNLLALERSIDLDPTVRHLVKVRASQINGCAYCLDMHWKDARAAGEREERLYGLDAWRESPLYDERERAALELTECMTLIAGSHVPDDVWARAAAAFPKPELAQLLFAIATINTWNRLLIAIRAEPGHYRPAAAGSRAGS